MTVEQWIGFQNGDWVESGVIDGCTVGLCATSQSSFHADSIGGVFNAVNDGTVNVGTQHTYQILEPTHNGDWYWSVDGSGVGAALGTPDYNGLNNNAGAETADISPTVPQTNLSQLSYYGTAWNPWSQGTLHTSVGSTMWVTNCGVPAQIQNIAVGTGSPGSC